MQRKLSSSGEIIASPSDYGIARKLLARPLSHSLGGAPTDAVVRTYGQLVNLDVHLDWTAPQLSRTLGTHERTIREHLYTHQEFEAAELKEPGRGQIAAKWRIIPGIDLSKFAESTLPTVAEVCELSGLSADQQSADESDVPF